VAFESRRAQEMATLISTYGGIPIVVPSIRETPLEENPSRSPLRKSCSPASSMR
jgi:uroporphyrinogen-III synthase